jgi:hypothetical protein
MRFHHFEAALILLALLLLVSFICTAKAHDSHGDGTGWLYDQECCHENDYTGTTARKIGRFGRD